MHANKENPRNGEGAFLRLKDGRIMYAYSRYVGENNHDHAEAVIAAIQSCDEGESWSDPRVLFPMEQGDKNNMCVSLFRRRDGSIALIYLVKLFTDDVFKTEIVMRLSYDEGKTWSDRRFVFGGDGYFIKENDRVTRLRDGRLVLPLNEHRTAKNHISEEGSALFVFSDDDGESWHVGENKVLFPSKSQTGLQETGVYELKNGRLLAYSRTGTGCQWLCYSSDRGESWSTPEPDAIFTSPVSPMNMRSLCGFTVAVFNPVPNYLGRNPHHRTWGRTPLVLAVSSDEYATAPRTYALETDPENGYCYASFFDGGDYLLAAYYHSDGTDSPLTSNKIVKVGRNEITD